MINLGRSVLVRIDDRIYKEIKRTQKDEKLRTGREPSFSKASRIYFDRLKNRNIEIIGL